MQKIITPICIIGGGPAGLLASLNLSKHKIHHVLVDKFAFPRDKVCGENFDGRVKHVFNRVNPGFFDELEQKGIIQFTHEFSIHLPKGEVPIHYNPEATPRILAKRIDFDKISFENSDVMDSRCIRMYNQAIKDKERPVSKRTGNWVQEYINYDDIKMHLESQFKYPERIQKLIDKSKEI